MSKKKVVSVVAVLAALGVLTSAGLSFAMGDNSVPEAPAQTAQSMSEPMDKGMPVSEPVDKAMPVSEPMDKDMPMSEPMDKGMDQGMDMGEAFKQMISISNRTK